MWRVARNDIKGDMEWDLPKRIHDALVGSRTYTISVLGRYRTYTKNIIIIRTRPGNGAVHKQNDETDGDEMSW